jgi:exodeoxyribonuclease VII small subunit
MAKTPSPKNLSYEQAYAELESLLERLEAADLPLEEALAVFERGQALAARCNELLDQAELRLRQLLPDDSAALTEGDLDLDDEDHDE